MINLQNVYISRRMAQFRRKRFRDVEKSVAGKKIRMWYSAQRDGRPVEHSWRPLFNTAKFG